MDGHGALTFSRRTLLVGATASLLVPLLASAQETKRAFTFLVLGLDTREENADQRSDALMVSRVDLEAVTVRTLSIPRDLYVEIPGHGYDKINVAYQRGLSLSDNLDWQVAAGVTIDTITHNFGVPIDGVALTDMNRFPAIIDAVGGITVENPYAFYDDTYFKRGFPAGVLHLNGADTLVFCRIRVPDGDGGRNMRQHLVLLAILAKLQDPAIVPKIPELIVAMSDLVRTTIPVDTQARLVPMIPGLSGDDIVFGNLDTQLWSGYTAGGAWIYQGDWATLPGYVQAWLDGTTG